MKKIIIFTDGGARGNPGIAGAGAVIVGEDGVVLKEVNKALGVTTNNEAEYQAVILGLETIKTMFSIDDLKSIEVELKVDSELIARQITGKYKVKEERLKNWWRVIDDLRADIPNLTVTEIRRELNKEADRLANEAMDSLA
jgi:ribonuclease HI